MDLNSPVCIFCGQVGKSSGEHMWPQWMHDAPELVQRPAESHSQLATMVKSNAGRVVIASTPYSRQGPGRNRKLQIACRDCNRTWMGSIETTAQTSLRSLHLGAPLTLNVIEQRAISRWAALRSIVFQHTLDDRVGIPYRDRMVLAHGDGLSDEWRVWVGIHDSSWREGRVRQAVPTVQPREALKFGEPPNSAMTMFGFGRIAMYAVRCPASQVGLPPPLYRAYCLRQIWPVEPAGVLVGEVEMDESMMQVLRDSMVADVAEFFPE